MQKSQATTTNSIAASSSIPQDEQKTKEAPLTTDDASSGQQPEVSSAGGLSKKSDNIRNHRLTKNKGYLPPCGVCGDDASGYHYGVYTCEGCKGFYRRALKMGADFRCAFDNNCDVTGPHRKLCACCRYRKCVDVGMSKKAIRIGRYTYETKTRNTIESRLRKQSELRNKQASKNGNRKSCGCCCHLAEVKSHSDAPPTSGQNTASASTIDTALFSEPVPDYLKDPNSQQLQPHPSVDSTTVDTHNAQPNELDQTITEDSQLSTSLHFQTSFEECCPEIKSSPSHTSSDTLSPQSHTSSDTLSPPSQTLSSFPLYSSPFPQGQRYTMNDFLAYIKATQLDIDHAFLGKHLEMMAKFQDFNSKLGIELEGSNYEKSDSPNWMDTADTSSDDQRDAHPEDTKKSKTECEVYSLSRYVQGGTDFQLDAITYELVTDHDKFLPVNTYFPPEFTRGRQTACLKEHARRRELMGNQRVLTEEEFLDVHRKTGLDVDGRINMITVHSGYMDAFLRSLIRFVKKVPGFRSLPLEDRTKMIKAARPAIVLLGSYRGYNKFLNVAVFPNGHCIHRDDLYRMFNRDFIDACFDIAHDLQQMSCCFSPHQTVLLKCLALTAIDSSSLTDPGGVERIRNLVLACLRRSLRSQRSEPTSTEDCAAASLAAVFPINRLAKLNAHSEIYRKYCLQKPLIKAILID